MQFITSYIKIKVFRTLWYNYFLILRKQTDLFGKEPCHILLNSTPMAACGAEELLKASLDRRRRDKEDLRQYSSSVLNALPGIDLIV